MHSERVLDALEDMLDNLTFAETWVGDLTEGAFVRDKVRFYAVTRALEIISEASRRLPDNMKNRHPTISWSQIAAAGNIYRHGYDLVAPERVWETVKEYLPPLKRMLETELAQTG